MTQQSKINKKSFEELYDKADKTKLLKDRLDIIYAIISIAGSIFSTIYSGKIIYAMGITLFLIKLLSWTKKREAKSIHKDGWRMHEKIICKKSNLLQYLLISASDTRKMYKYMGEKQKNISAT